MDYLSDLRSPLKGERGTSRAVGPGHRRRRPGRQTLQAERLSRQSRAALLLAGILTELTGQLAPRAVAREQAQRHALRHDRRQHQQFRPEEAQSDHGEGKVELAV